MMAISRIRQLLDSAAAVRAETGKPLLRQFSEAVRLMLPPSRLDMSEYYSYGAYDDAKIDAPHRREMIGWRESARIDRVLNTERWRAVANNKLLCYLFLDGLRIPRPANYAIYSPVPVQADGEQCLESPEAARDFLRSTDRYPLFIKPIQGTFGRDAYALSGYDAAGENLKLKNGRLLPWNLFLPRMLFPPNGGMLFQQLLTPHPDLRDRCGDRLSTVRIVLIREMDRFQVLLGLWKVPVGNNMVDNFSHGSTGNMLAWVEVDTGKVVRVISGMGTTRRECAIHPDTKNEIAGFLLPDWQTAVTLCLKAACYLPGLRLQHWDVALAEDGPVVLELNSEGDLAGPQLVGYAGTRTLQVIRAMKNSGH